MTDSLHTIADHIRYAFSYMNRAEMYFGHGYQDAWDESVALVLQILHLPWDFDQQLWGCRLLDEERSAVLEAIRKRVDDRMPLAYVTGKAWFCGLPFEVDERVLVPRSPIAELIERGFGPWLRHEPNRVLDMCTGSACIGIACAHVFEGAQVDCADVSADALQVAERNVVLHKLQDRVHLHHSDVFDGLDASCRGQYDLIVSNPPYVDAQDVSTMPEEYRKEPPIGLASGADGLDITRRILKEAAHWLSDQGLLVVELGNSWVNLEAAYPDFSFTWVEFEHGGHGVFVMTAHELKTGKW
ncbi:MAG: 50S ribosomal protein L3 N(5)-glutamine methyltransferase [Oleiphilus sp.]|nr:MAG: 50S ribosomal protein L3 N(5)-glutamine methyltransferase [Oleiphilus sp.]